MIQRGEGVVWTTGDPDSDEFQADLAQMEAEYEECVVRDPSTGALIEVYEDFISVSLPADTSQDQFIACAKPLLPKDVNSPDFAVGAFTQLAPNKVDKKELIGQGALDLLGEPDIFQGKAGLLRIDTGPMLLAWSVEANSTDGLFSMSIVAEALPDVRWIVDMILSEVDQDSRDALVAKVHEVFPSDAATV